MLRVLVIMVAAATIVTAMITGLANHLGPFAVAAMDMRATLT
jgi:hypothetical protein